MTRRQKIALSLVTTAAAAAVTVPIIASSAPPAPLLPDLVSDAPTGPRFDTYDPVNGVPRLLIRFDGYIHNDGDGPIDVQGNPNYPTMTPAINSTPAARTCRRCRCRWTSTSGTAPARAPATP